jgi:purine-cytosine permease-like protein
VFTDPVIAEQVEVEADKPWSIEQHAIEPIPSADRHGSPKELFRMWIGANMNYVVLVTGALAVTQGLSFWESISAILIGNVLGCCVVGLSSIMGPKTGSAAIITSRPSFGQLGAILPIFISTIAAIGWFSINSVVATQSLIEVFKLVGLPGLTHLRLASPCSSCWWPKSRWPCTATRPSSRPSERLASMVLVVMFLGLLICRRT